MRFLAAVLCALALVSCTRTPAETPAPQPGDFAELRHAVVELTTAEGTGFCSAVAISERRVLTAAHCDIGKDIYVNGFRAFIVKKDEAKDLMLLHVPVGVKCPCVWMHLINPDLDSPVYVVGFPLDRGQVLTEGRVQTVDKDGFLIFTAPVTWGNSGGGVFVRGPFGWMLVGIVSRGTVVPAGFVPVIVGHLNMAASPENISVFLEGA